MRSLDEDAGAIASICFTTASTAVVEVEENTQGLTDDIVGFSAFDIDEETDTASFMLELRIVQALFGGRPDDGARSTRRGR